MNTQIFGLRVAGTLAGLIALAQFARLLARVTIVVEGITVPLWPSAIAVLVAGGLAWWFWRLSLPATPPAATPPKDTTAA